MKPRFFFLLLIISAVVVLLLVITAGGGAYLSYSNLGSSEGNSGTSKKQLTLKEKNCKETGGMVETSSCCKSVEDFPNQCNIGACGCAPKDSHQVKVCNCPERKCFNGEECIIRGVSFSRSGNLVRNNPGLKSGEWYLVYEKPGAPGINVRLEINNESVCIKQSEKKDCFSINFKQGQRVEVQGKKSEEKVIVEKIILK